MNGFVLRLIGWLLCNFRQYKKMTQKVTSINIAILQIANIANLSFSNPFRKNVNDLDSTFAITTNNATISTL